MKRLTETDKWQDPWFRSLPAPSKLLFFYIVDNCDHAGFLELDRDLIIFLMKMKLDHVDGALKGLQRAIVGPFDGFYWVRRFLRHQLNDHLNPANPYHKRILRILHSQQQRFSSCPEFQEFISPYMDLLRGFDAPYEKRRDDKIGENKRREEKSTKKEQKKKFQKPTREEAHAYAKEIDLPVARCDTWYDHHESNGWLVSGRAKMQDWRSSMRTWKSNEPLFSRGKSTSKPEQKFTVV